MERSPLGGRFFYGEIARLGNFFEKERQIDLKLFLWREAVNATVTNNCFQFPNFPIPPF